MTPQELRELDEWVGRNVFNIADFWGVTKRGLFYRPGAAGYTAIEAEAGHFTHEEAKRHEAIRGEQDDVTIFKFTHARYTTDPAAALEVLAECAKKAPAGNVGIMWIKPGSDVAKAAKLKEWSVSAIGFTVQADMLPLAICLFARALFAGRKGEA